MHLRKINYQNQQKQIQGVSNMAFAFDEIFAYGGQLIVAAKKVVPRALGIG